MSIPFQFLSVSASCCCHCGRGVNGEVVAHGFDVICLPCARAIGVLAIKPTDELGAPEKDLLAVWIELSEDQRADVMVALRGLLAPPAPIEDTPPVVYTCKDCNKPFASEAALRGHMRAHKGESKETFEGGLKSEVLI